MPLAASMQSLRLTGRGRCSWVLQVWHDAIPNAKHTVVSGRRVLDCLDLPGSVLNGCGNNKFLKDSVKVSNSEMDDELKDLLNSWKINQTYIQRLADQEIYTVEMLLHLSDENIKQIFNTLGSQISFTKHFEKFKAEKVAALNAGEGNNTSEGQSFANSENAENEEGWSTVMDESNESSNATQKSLKETGKSGPSNDKLTVEASRKRKFSFEIDMDLKKLLERTVDGKVVLSYYRTSNDLSDCMRNTLADVILNEHLKEDYDRKLSFDSELYFAEKICELFPTENKEVWVSSTPGARQNSCGRAKLLTRYYQKRRFLRKGKLLKKDVQDNQDTSNLSSDDDDPNEERNDDVLWLKNNRQPWSKVEALWKSTSSYRMRRLKAKNTSTDSYMNAYPALRDPSGYLLLEMDFDEQYPNSRVNLYAEWPKLSAFIESKLNKRELDLIQSCLTPDGRKIQTIWCLPHLFNVTTCAKRGRTKQWRPSRLEVAEALLLHVKCVGDIEPTLIRRLQEKYEPYQMSLFPQAIVVGADVDSIGQSYIRLNNCLYQVDNPQKAIDITFKIFHTLDVKYHAEAEREWLFLERAVYEVNAGKGGDAKVFKCVMPGVPNVPCCECKFNFPDLFSFRVHFGISHQNVKTFNCAFDKCNRKFSQYYAFRRHAISVHQALVFVKEPSQKPCVTFSHDNNLENLENLENYDNSADNVCDENTVCNVEDLLMQEQDYLVAKLYSNPAFPRNMVGHVIDNFSKYLTSPFFENMRHVVTSSLDPNLSLARKQEIEKMFDITMNPFPHLQTEFKRLKYFEANGEYIPPETYEIYSREERVKTKDGVVLKMMKSPPFVNGRNPNGQG
ncbi:Transcription factor YY2 [Frankliniella fusca]|uniref:Transcription factor YY2 n=1 Tax=Frankliniella fusca TaxID=407009 RepID=A0AAE1HCB2_9NEOP|nr:Transcription factor YY2 [Frankliniella fusca]KAK3918534.1 Transcription factor YY2 [Frankliniella fusca]KAK3919811.1 Transcription factor YY2 [Frankliniella fusca]KAK3927630.1 Transcription factor YY2 [Frankliniella fusca]